MKRFKNFISLFIVFFLASTICVKGAPINYNPSAIMPGGNTTIFGGRYAYDSREVQNYIFKGGYPSDREKVVFLTFDDGPSLDNTPRVLDILKANDVKGTFFVLGSNVEKGEEYKNMLRRTIAEGHAIANHGYSHNYSYLYPGRNISYTNLKSDMEKSLDILKEALGESFHTRVWRLPGGLRSWKGQNETLTNLNNENFSVIEWNALSGDAEGRNVSDPNVFVNNAIKTAGSARMVVLLMHDFSGKAGRISSEALPKIISHFKENGYEFRTLY